jgi:hypothetical protein
VDCHTDLKSERSRVTLRAKGAKVRYLPFVVPHDRCERCHLPYHGEQFAGRPDGGGCAGCHAVETFRRAIRFDHDRDAAFRLEGAHERLSCERCHPNEAAVDGTNRVVYAPLPHACRNCHGGEHFDSTGGSS